MVIRDLLRKRPTLKLVLMSATLDVDLFASYFRDDKGSSAPLPPRIRMPGRTFPVLSLYLEDVLEITQHKVGGWVGEGNLTHLLQQAPTAQP